MRISSSLLGFAALSAAQNIVTYCVHENNGVCFSLHVPTGSASEGSGDVFMQIVSPTTFPWVGLGQSSEGTMAGANIFVVYPNANDGNVTISSRAGLGHSSPKPGAGANLTLLEGSGIIDGKMVANIRCTNCNAWQSGADTMDLASGGESRWIYAYGPESAKQIRNNSASAAISYHDGYGAFDADLSAARGGDADTTNENPFLNRAVPTSSSGSVSTYSWSDMHMGEVEQRARIAHAVLGGLAFGLFFPLGAILMRLCAFKPRNNWKVHAGIQMAGYLLAWATLGTGVWLANRHHQLSEPHAIVGLVAVAGVGILPVLGWMQHHYFVRSARRTAWGYVHAYFGRAVVILGIVNLPLGLDLIKPYNPVPARKGQIAWGVLVGLIGIGWMGVVAVTGWKRRRAAGKGEGAGAVLWSEASDNEKVVGSLGLARSGSGAASDSEATTGNGSVRSHLEKEGRVVEPVESRGS